MKINRISTYILLCLLTSQISNLLVPVRADDEGAEGSVIAPTADGAAIQPVDPATQLKLFKDDSNNNKVQIEATEFFQDRYRGHLTYVLRKGVMCTLVRFGDKDVWKRGDQGVEHPKSVTYDSVLKELAVRDANNSVHFGMDSQTREWKHVVTYDRKKKLAATKRDKTVTFLRPPRPRSSYSLPVLFSLGLSSYDPVLKSGSTTLPKQAASQEPVKSPVNEADQASTVPLGTSEAQPESGSGSALRGTTGTAEGSGETEEPTKVSSGEADGTTEQGQEATKEENQTEDGGVKEASAEADGSTGQTSEDAGWTAGGSTDGTAPAAPEASEGSTAGDGSANGASTEADGTVTVPAEGVSSGEAGQDSSGGGWTAGEGADGTSGSPPADGGSTTHTGGGDGSGTGADGTSTSADGSASGAGTEADGSSQPSGEAPTYGGTGTRDQDGSAGGSTEAGGSTTTPPPSSGGDDTSSTPGQGPTTPTGSPAGGTETGTKTGVELSIKKTSGTNEFNYEKSGQVAKYTAKSGYGFSSVKTKSGGCSGCCGSEVPIWDAKETSEYSTIVVVDGKGKKQKEVTIHQSNGNKKVFKKDKNNPWSEVNQQSNESTGQQASGTLAGGSNQDPDGTSSGGGNE